MIKLEIKNTYISELFDKLSLFTKIKLKGPLSRDSHFKIYFRSKYRGNRGSCQSFHGIPFSKDRVLINPDHVTFRFLFQTYFALVVKI